MTAVLFGEERLVQIERRRQGVTFLWTDKDRCQPSTRLLARQRQSCHTDHDQWATRFWPSGKFSHFRTNFAATKAVGKSNYQISARMVEDTSE